MIDPTLLTLMPDTVLIAAPGARDTRGNITFGPDVRYRAQVDSDPRALRSLTGTEVISNAVVRLAPVRVEANGSLTYLDALPVITPNHRITLPNGSKPIILTVAELSTIPSLAHLEIRV